jgi:hypothetical protein
MKILFAYRKCRPFGNLSLEINEVSGEPFFLSGSIVALEDWLQQNKIDINA